MFKAFIEPDLEQAKIRINSTYNPMNNLLEPTYLYYVFRINRVWCTEIRVQNKVQQSRKSIWAPFQRSGSAKDHILWYQLMIFFIWGIVSLGLKICTFTLPAKEMWIPWIKQTVLIGFAFDAWVLIIVSFNNSILFRTSAFYSLTKWRHLLLQWDYGSTSQHPTFYQFWDFS